MVLFVFAAAFALVGLLGSIIAFVTETGRGADFFCAGPIMFIAFGWAALHQATEIRRRMGEPPKSASAHPLCSRCDYDLTGNVSGVCPECGLKVGAT